MTLLEKQDNQNTVVPSPQDTELAAEASRYWRRGRRSG